MILKQSDLFVHTTISPDPLPTVLLESLYHSLPAVATNLGGAIEILDHGRNGLLIPTEDFKKAASLIYDYSKDKSLQKEHLKKSKIKLKTDFNSKSFEKNILNEVNKLM